jgi:glycosyltransferase involved in cell wall biosynthesis
VTRAVFAIPGDLNTPTGGYAYDRQVMAMLPACGVDIRHLALPDGFPFPDADALAESGRLLAAVPGDEVLIIDGLALGVLPASLLEGIAAPIIAMHHHPLGLETGLAPEAGAALLASEKAATGFARHVIVTSPTTADILAEHGFAPPPPVTVAIPGTPPSKRAVGSGGDRLEIISVGTVVPRKGYDVLVTALAMLKGEPWHCTIIGGLDRDIACADALKAQIAAEGLQDRITLTGAVFGEATDRMLHHADLFVSPSRYEGYGMALAGALSRGLPVLSTTAPAIPQTVPPGTGLLVVPDDAAAFAEGLRRLMHDQALRRQLSDAAFAHGQSLPRWEDTAAIIAGVIKEVGR